MVINKQLLRLSLFQFGVGFSMVVFTGSLNRVLIYEEGIPAGIVGWLLSLGLFVAPIRALLGFRSDREKKTYGYRRLPYIWYGMMMVFCALSAAPFVLLLLSKSSAIGQTETPMSVAIGLSTFIFLLYALGVHVSQTGYLALVTDLTPRQDRSRAVAFLWIMLIIGQILSSLVISVWLQDFSPFKLIQVMQTSSVLFLVLAIAGIWKQDKPVEVTDEEGNLKGQVGKLFASGKMRLLFAIVFIGTLGLTMQDVLLEPYGGQVLRMTVSQTSGLTALWGMGMLMAMLAAWKVLPKLQSPLGIVVLGCVAGLVGFGLITYASVTLSVVVFATGTAIIGFANGLFLIATLSLIMSMADLQTAGLYVGLWGLTQTTATGLGTLAGSNARDMVTASTNSIAGGYTAVYVAEMFLIVVTLVFLWRLMRGAERISFNTVTESQKPFAGLTDIPGS